MKTITNWFTNNYKYKVKFDFVNEYGELVNTNLDNNGTGFVLQDALDVQIQLVQRGNQNVTIERIE